jgi:hypothetical protein
MVLPWCVVAALVSSVVLVTGWFVCCGIPEKARARQLIQGSVACAGIALSMIVVLQVLAVVVTPPAPKIPSFTDPRRPPTDAEMRTAQSEFKEAQMKSASAARTVATTGKVLIWLAVMAWAAGVAVFGLFVAAASEHLGDSRLRPWSYAVAGVQGVIALCMTLFLFEVVSTSPTIVKYLAILSTVLHPVAYAGLIYMVSQARREVPAG